MAFPMRSPTLPAPLVPGAALLCCISGFHACQTLFYFIGGAFGFDLAEAGEAAMGHPLASSLAAVDAAASG